jgi:hypothetical protein
MTEGQRYFFIKEFPESGKKVYYDLANKCFLIENPCAPSCRLYPTDEEFKIINRDQLIQDIISSLGLKE